MARSKQVRQQAAPRSPSPPPPPHPDDMNDPEYIEHLEQALDREEDRRSRLVRKLRQYRSKGADLLKQLADARSEAAQARSSEEFLRMKLAARGDEKNIPKLEPQNAADAAASTPVAPTHRGFGGVILYPRKPKVPIKTFKITFNKNAPAAAAGDNHKADAHVSLHRSEGGDA